MDSFILTRKKTYEADKWRHEYWAKGFDTPLYDMKTYDTMSDRQKYQVSQHLPQYKQRYCEGFLSRKCKQIGRAHV